VIVTDLRAPLVLALDMAGNVYVNEVGAGEVSQINLAHGTKRVIATGLRTPQGLAIGADGSLFVIERDAKQLTRIDARTGVTEAIATNLPVGRLGVPNATAGVAAGMHGTLYVMSDIENSIYRLEPRPRR
jgi:glucose/arabinose dehydrogenase